MRYLYIPIAMIVVLVCYLVYLVFVKKDMKKFKSSLTIGLFFIAVWAIVYYLIL